MASFPKSLLLLTVILTTACKKSVSSSSTLAPGNASLASANTSPIPEQHSEVPNFHDFAGIRIDLQLDAFKKQYSIKDENCRSSPMDIEKFDYVIGDGSRSFAATECSFVIHENNYRVAATFYKQQLLALTLDVCLEEGDVICVGVPRHSRDHPTLHTALANLKKKSGLNTARYVPLIVNGSPACAIALGNTIFEVQATGSIVTLGNEDAKCREEDLPRQGLWKLKYLNRARIDAMKIEIINEMKHSSEFDMKI